MTETKIVIENAESLGLPMKTIFNEKHVLSRVRMSEGLHALLSKEENAALVDSDPGLGSLLMLLDPVTSVSQIEAGNLGVMFGVPVIADHTLGERELVLESKPLAG